MDRRRPRRSAAVSVLAMTFLVCAAGGSGASLSTTESEFWRWCSRVGISIGGMQIRPADDAHSRGLIATRDLKAGEIVLSVPHDRIFRVSAIPIPTDAESEADRKRTSGQIALEIMTELCAELELTTRTQLAIYLLAERLSPSGGEWSPYIQLLAELTFDSVPGVSFEPKQHLSGWLNGSHIVPQIYDQRSDWMDEYDRLSACAPKYFAPNASVDDPAPAIAPASGSRSGGTDQRWNRAALVWALNSVLTRRFGFQRNGSSDCGLVPVADLMNHANPKLRNVKWFFSRSRDCFLMKTTKPVACGRELFDSYGEDRSGQNTLAQYGFLPPPETETESESESAASVSVADADMESDGLYTGCLILRLSRADPLYNIKLRILIPNARVRRRYDDTWQFFVGGLDSHFSARYLNALSFARYAAAADSDFRVLHQNSFFDIRRQIGFPVAESDTDPPSPVAAYAPVPALTVRNEMRALRILLSAAERALRRFPPPPSVHADTALLRRAGTGVWHWNEQNAIRLRRGEKRALHSLIHRFRILLSLYELAWKSVSRFRATAKSAVLRQLLHVLSDAKTDIPPTLRIDDAQSVTALRRYRELGFSAYVLHVMAPLLHHSEHTYERFHCASSQYRRAMVWIAPRRLRTTWECEVRICGLTHA